MVFVGAEFSAREWRGWGAFGTAWIESGVKLQVRRCDLDNSECIVPNYCTVTRNEVLLLSLSTLDNELSRFDIPIICI